MSPEESGVPATTPNVAIPAPTHPVNNGKKKKNIKSFFIEPPLRECLSPSIPPAVSPVRQQMERMELMPHHSTFHKLLPLTCFDFPLHCLACYTNPMLNHLLHHEVPQRIQATCLQRHLFHKTHQTAKYDHLLASRQKGLRPFFDHLLFSKMLHSLL